MSAGVDHLTCQELVEVLTDYLEGVAEPAARAEVERHIVFCRGCSNYVEQMRSTIDLLGRVAGDDAEPAGRPPDALLEIFRTWKAGRSP